MLELLKSIDAFAWGPPLLIAVATPIIFPVPTVAARAVHKAAKTGYIPMPLILDKNKLEGLGQTQNLQES